MSSAVFLVRKNFYWFIAGLAWGTGVRGGTKRIHCWQSKGRKKLPRLTLSHCGMCSCGTTDGHSPPGQAPQWAGFSQHPDFSSSSSDLTAFTLQVKPGDKADLSSGKHQGLVLPEQRAALQSLLAAVQCGKALPFCWRAQCSACASQLWETGLGTFSISPRTCPGWEDALGAGVSCLFST